MHLNSAAKYSFDLRYALKTNMIQSSAQLELEKKLKQQLSGDYTIQVLKEMMLKLRPNDTIVWDNVEQE